MSGLGFSAPWLLLAALAAAGPIAAHLVRHEDREGRGFPSLMFLRRVPFATRSRRKLADRALLALRVLAILALVFSFAQPYLLVGDAHAAPPQSARVVLLDRSYSMRVGARFEHARRAAHDALSVGDDSMRVALVVFDASASTLSGFAAGPAAALRALRSLSPGNRATDLGNALGHASRLLAGAAVARREIILISDLQLSGLGADPVLASDIELQVRRIDGQVPGNLAVLGAWYDKRDGSQDAALTLRVRIANTGDEALSSSLRVQVDGLPAARQRVSLAPGARRELLVPVFVARERPTRVRLQVEDDALAIDNARYLVIAPLRPVNVLWVGDSSRGNTYVNAALSPSPAHSFAARGASVRVQSVDMTNIETRQIDAADVIVLEGVMPKASRLAAAIGQRVARGAGLLTVMGGTTPLVAQASAQPGGPLATVVAGVAGARLRTRADFDAGVRGHVRGTALAALTREHAIAAALGDASLSGIAVRRYQPLESGRDERVLLHFEDGAPALIERDYGLGRSITMALSLDPQSSDLVLDPVFVPLLVELLVHLSQRGVARLQYEPGDLLDVARYADALRGGGELAAALRARRAVQLRTPSGAVQRVAAGGSAVLTQSGFYELRVAGATPLPLAVNPVAAESLLAALTVAQFRARIHRGRALANTQPRAVATDRRDTRIAWWALSLAIAALFGEALFGAWLARRRMTQQAAS